MYAFVYSQSTGLFYVEDFDGNRAAFARGYSGFGPDQNDPDAEGKAGRGPIPRGVWKIGAPVHHIGVMSDRLERESERSEPDMVYRTSNFPLQPVGHDAYHRSEFFIHGDNRRGDKSASTGCIVLNRPTRECIRSLTSIRTLEVIL